MIHLTCVFSNDDPIGRFDDSSCVVAISATTYREAIEIAREATGYTNCTMISADTTDTTPIVYRNYD